MASRGFCSSLFGIFFAFVVFSGAFSAGGFAQQSGGKATGSSHQDNDRDRPYLRDDLSWNWNQRGRSVPGGESAAGLRFRAYRQKMAMRAQRAAAAETGARKILGGATASLSGSTAWMPLGPAPLASDATGDGAQDYNWVSGRATSVLIDPADASGNTVLLGGAYGGLWKSTNAGSLNSNPALVTWQALIDDQPTLAVGAIALQPVVNKNVSNVILVGTGETNSSGDSYYGLGILRSADGGATWTQIQSAGTGQSFLGIGFSKIAFSTANPNLVVAATAGDNGLYFGLEEDRNSTARGLYDSQDGGVTWNRVTLTDGAVPASATAVIYNPSQGATGTFYAFIRRHGLYSSTDGQNFTPLPTQPTAGLASANCPTGSNARSCLIYRGEFAVVPGRNEMYVWVVDVQPDDNGNPAPADEGIWQSMNGGANWTQIPDNGITNCGDSAFGPNSGCGVEQGWYNLELAAIPDGGVTDIYAGAINLYKCTLAGGATCTQGDWINLTHVYGCSPLAAPAHVHPDQHGIGFMVVGGMSPGYFAHDGGISRTLDGYAGLTTGSCTGTNQFDSLSQSLGSMTEFVSFSVDPSDADILLGGTQDNGSPKTSTATISSTWQNALGGDGGFTAINPTNLNEWFASNPYVTILKCESGTACNDAGFIQVVSSSNLGGDQGAFYTPYILDPQNASEMLIGTCRAWSISTSGTAPVQLSNDFDTLGTGVCTGDEINLVNALAAGGPTANGNSSVVYAVTNGYGPLSGYPGGEVWVTTSAGVTLMTNVTQNANQNVNPNGYAISTVAMDSSDATGNTAYVGIMGFSTPGFPTSHVWKTANAGASWTDWTGTGVTELPDNPVNALLVDAQASQIYAGTDVGVFVSSTTTPGWTEVGPMPGPGASGFLPNAPVTALQLFNPEAGAKTLVASTYGRGVWNAALSPDFAIALTSTPNVTVVNQNLTWNGTLKALDGYSGSVTLTCTAGAPGTCTISPQTLTPIAGGAAFTVTLGSVTVGTFNFTIQGTDGTLTHATPTETLTVGTDVTWTDTGATSVTLLAGQSASYTFSAVPVGGGTFTSVVNFGCANLPALTSCGFSPASIAAGSGTTAVTLTISTKGPNAGTQAKPRVGSTPRSSGTIRLPPWLRSEPRQNKQARGDGRLYTVAARPRTSPLFALAWVVMVGILGLRRKRRGEPHLLGIALIGLGLGVMAEISCGGIVGSGGGSSPDFTIAITPTPNLTGESPQAVIWNGTLTALNGYSGNVTLSCTAGAPGICLITPPTVVPASVGAPFTVMLGNATAGTFNFTIQGTDGTLTHATPTETLTVTPPGPDFAIAVTPTPNSTPVNQNVTWNGTLTALDGYTGIVTLSCGAGAPATCIAPAPVTPTISGAPFAMTLGNPASGTFNFIIQGTDGTLTHTTPTETLTVGTGVGTPDFAIALTPTPNSVGVSPQTVVWYGTLTALNGYIGNVTLTCTAGDPGICVPTGPVTPTATGARFAVTLGNATAGTFNFTIQGTDGTLTHATPTETLTVGTAVTISPASAALFADEAGNSWPVGATQQQFTATVNGATNQSVTWAVTGGNSNGTVDATGLYTAPAGVPNPATVTVTATSALVSSPGSTFVTVATPTGLGTTQITVTATAAGGAAHGDVVTLTVQ